METLGLSGRQLNALRRVAKSSSYHLTFGVGVDTGSVNRRGSLVSNSLILADRLVSEFEVLREPGDALGRLYDRAVAKYGVQAVYKWLRSELNEVRPSSSLEELAKFPWNSIWTLCLDDAFEQAYEAVRSEHSRKSKTVSWDDPYSSTRDLSIIHLHGHLRYASPRRVLFSLAPNADPASKKAVWASTFTDTYGISPMVIFGGPLRDEPDIEATIAGRKPEHEAPSFYVSPEISEGMCADLKAWGLVPVEATVDEFMKVWRDLTSFDPDGVSDYSNEAYLGLRRQFRELTLSSAAKGSKTDFLLGYEPRWSDIVSGVHAELGWMKDGASLVRQFEGADSSSCMIFLGQRWTGKTTGLYAITRAFLKASWRAFLYIADQRPDPDVVLDFASDGRSVLLVFDGLADFAEDVASIVREARERNLAVACLAVDHDGREENILGRIPQDLLIDDVVHSVPLELSKSDAHSLLKALEPAGRLGILEDRDYEGRVAHFFKKELFRQMAALEDAPGFGHRIGEEVKSLENEEDVELLFFAAFAMRVDKGLSVLDAARMCGMRSEGVVHKIRNSNQLAALIACDGQYLRTRQRWLALAPLIERMGPKRALDVLAEGIRRLSTRLSRKSNRERNSTSVLVGALMKYSTLKEFFPSEDFEAWYGSMLPTFGEWSGRYWEQRAIMSRHEGEKQPDAYVRAVSYASRAVTLLDDTYSYTTLGTVLAARATLEAESDWETCLKYYERAYDAFQAAGLRDRDNLVTWTAYLRSTLPVLENLSAGSDAELAELRARIRADWMSIYEHVAAKLLGGNLARSNHNALLRRFGLANTSLNRTSDSPPPSAAVSETKPSIEGLATVGNVLTVIPGVWPPTHTLSYKWKRNGIEIQGEARESYFVSEADIGSSISVVVTGKRLGYGPLSKSTSPTRPVEAP